MMHGRLPQHPGGHHERSGHAELCLLNEPTQVSCALLLLQKQALLRASTNRLQSLVAGDPTLAASSTEWLEILSNVSLTSERSLRWIAELSHARPIHNPLPPHPVLEQKAAVTLVHFAPLQSHSWPQTSKRVGRGGAPDGPIVVINHMGRIRVSMSKLGGGATEVQGEQHERHAETRRSPQ